MFGYKNILLISEGNLIASRVSGKKIKTTLSFVWTNENLRQQLAVIKNRFGASFRILLDDSYVHTAHIYLPPNNYNVRSVVQEKAQQIIPEDLNQTVWDFKEEPQLRDNNQKDGRFYQILAINREFHLLLSGAISALGLKIEAIEPISQSLARMLAKKQDEPFLIIYRQSNYILTACFGDIVINVKNIGPNFNMEMLKEYQYFLEQEYGLKPNSVLVPNQITAVAEIEKSDLNLKRYDYNPEFALYQKTDLKGNDLSVLNLDPQRPRNTNPENPSVNKRPVWLAIVLLLAIVVLWFVTQNGKKTENLKTTKTEVVNLPADSKPKKAVLVDYKITILNGNGVEGAAAKAKTLLENKGYKVVNLDNADNYDYEQTVLRHKKKVSGAFLDKLNKLLKTQYDTIVEKEFIDQSETNSDVIIILGQK
jgi:hypothetical protein